MNIAFLLPRSISYPRIGTEFLAGFRSASPDPSFNLFIEDYDAKDPAATSLEKTQKLLLEKDPDLFIVFGGKTNYEQTAQYLAENRKPVLFTDMGAQIPTYHDASPFIVHNSFEVWKSSFALGAWEINSGFNCGVAFDFYEAGYHVQNGFSFMLRTTGAREAFYYAQPQTAHRPEMDRLNELMEAGGSEYLFAAYSGKFAASFLQDVVQLRKPVKTLYLPSMMALPEAHEGVKPLPMPVRLAATWHAAMEEPFNLSWGNAIAEKTGAPASPFHVLGVEAALWLQAALAANGGSAAPMKLAEAFASVSFAGPRGTVKVDSALRRTVPLHHLFELQPAGDSVKMSPRILKDQPDPQPIIDYYAAQIGAGWKNIFPTTH